MWFKLATADFSAKNLGTMADIAGSWSVSYTIQGGISKNSCPTSVKMNDEKTQAAADFTATFTLADGATLTSITATLKSTGATLVTETSTTSITIPAASITGDIAITAIASGVSTGGGEEDGGSDGDDTTTPGGIGLGGTLVSSGNMAGAYLLENSSYTSTTYADGATAGNDVYFIYDLIPVEPSTTYRLAYGRAYFELDSTGTQIGSRGNLTSGATDFTFTTSSTAAYISVAFKYEEVSTANVKLQTQSMVQTGEALLSTLTSDYNDGYGLESGSYADEADANFYTYKNIPVTGGGTYAIPYARSTWFLDSNKAGLYRKNLTNDVADWTHTVTSDVAYISTSIKHAECNKNEAKLITYELQWV